MAIVATPEQPMLGEYFAFDIETVGPPENPAACFIWDLCITHLCSRHVLQYKIDPQLDAYPAPPHKDLFRVTAGYLQNANAQPFAVVLPRIVAFVTEHCTRQASNQHNKTPTVVPALFVSHGGFCLDKPVLEREFARQNCVIPAKWYFYDTLPFFRRQYRRLPSYALNCLYQSVFWVPPAASHFAAADVLTLVHLLLHATGGNTTLLTGAYCPAYLTPLQTVKYIGSHKELLLVQHASVTSVEDLICLLAKQCGLEKNAIALFLHESCKFERASAIKVAQSVTNLLLK